MVDSDVLGLRGDDLEDGLEISQNVLEYFSESWTCEKNDEVGRGDGEVLLEGGEVSFDFDEVEEIFSVTGGD